MKIDAILTAISIALSYVAGGLMTAFSAYDVAVESNVATVLVLVGGATLAVTAIYKTVVSIKKGGRLTALTMIPESTAFLFVMIGGIIARGQYTMTVQILFFAFALVEDSALAALIFGGIPYKKATIVSVGLAAISVIIIFIPVFVGQADVLSALRDYSPLSLACISTTLLVAGRFDRSNKQNETR